jgi:hypothetical protein
LRSASGDALVDARLVVKRVPILEQLDDRIKPALDPSDGTVQFLGHLRSLVSIVVFLILSKR